jgi:hypothetical protein
VVWQNGATLGCQLLAYSKLTGTPSVPAPGRVYFGPSSGVSPGSDALFTFNAAGDEQLVIGPTAFTSWYNATGANAEYVAAGWNANVFRLTSQQSGTGTVRPMLLDPGTSTLTLAGLVRLSALASAGAHNYLKIVDGSGTIGLGDSSTGLLAATLVNTAGTSSGSVEFNADPTLADNYLAIGAATPDVINSAPSSGIDRRRTFVFYVNWIPFASTTYYLVPGQASPPTTVQEFYFDNFQPTVAHLTANITSNTLTGGGSPSITCSATRNGGGTILVALPAITGTGAYTTGDVTISTGTTNNSWGLACSGSSGLVSGSVTGTFTMEIR